MLTPQRLTDIDSAQYLHRNQSAATEVSTRALEIVTAVQQGGDAALRRLTSELDNVDLAEPFLATESWNELAAQCPADVQAAIRGNLARIVAFHDRQVGKSDEVEVSPGILLGRRPVPFNVAACYVPGGRASYPSSVLMTVTPAKLAGVARIIVVTPPRRDGTVDPAVAYAAQVAGATDVLLAGGAQAIAALAYGTQSIPRADCIVGPGNAYVTAAKQLVRDMVWTDAPAGPSELMVIADDASEPSFIAADLVAQAEHDPDAQCLLVSNSAKMADRVAAELAGQAAAAARSEIITQSLSKHGAIIVTDSIADAVDFANQYAPEHLEIMCENANNIAMQIRNAGSIFIGPYAPVPIGDYGSGTNHVLPTMGYGRIRGGLCVDDFRKWLTWQEVSKDGLASIAEDVTTLAMAEGLHGHADAVRRRLEGDA